MVSRTKERALDPLLVPALPALACGHAVNICWLRSASASDTLAHSILSILQHPCSSTAVPESQSSQILLNSACRLRPASRTVAG
jgi:hypothetical protein